MHNLKYIVRWTDQNGKGQRREYAVETEARKARDWLRANGADDADVAVIMNDREIGSSKPDSSMFPAKEPPKQQDLL